MDAPTTEKKKDNKHRPSLSTVLSMVDVVFFYHNHYSYLVSHKQYWWASKQWYLFFSFNPESSAGSQLSFCLWLLYFTIVSVHFQCGSAKDMWRRIRRRKMTRINDKKTKNSPLSCEGKETKACCASLLLASKSGLRNTRTEKAELFLIATHLASSGKVFPRLC